MIYYVPSDYIDMFPNIDSVHKHIAEEGTTVIIYKTITDFVKAFNNEEISDLGVLYTEENIKPLLYLGKEDLYRNGFSEDVDETTFEEIVYNVGENLSNYLDDEIENVCENMGISKRKRGLVSDCCGAPDFGEDVCGVCGEICEFVEQ